jgi:hypothetical protein
VVPGSWGGGGTSTLHLLCFSARIILLKPRHPGCPGWWTAGVVPGSWGGRAPSTLH